ncbi:hypothetical protein AMECASPLE_013167 [Ameca splendens]|uniref:Uncharacterized protein n=1 Tax=Ameca splendens TaxID=208324 RepID=A0ABV0YZB1_9TELE
MIKSGPHSKKKGRPAGPVQPEYTTQRRAHDPTCPKTPRTHGAEPTEHLVPDARHRTAATTRQTGQQNTSHTNTEAADKPHPPQNGRPTQIQFKIQKCFINPKGKLNVVAHYVGFFKEPL